MTSFAVVGLGYVGLPLIKAAVHSGWRGVGIDASVSLVASLNAGRSHVDDISDADVEHMLVAGFNATTDFSVLDGVEVVVICVPTPLSEEGGPDLSAVRAAAEAVRDHLRPGMLVILESTTWPGTTDEFLCPILEETGLRAGEDFSLAYSPERIDPGNEAFGIENTPKVVGGFTVGCGLRAAQFYEHFISEVVIASGAREAEMAKLLENTYRQVNIALVNEMAKFSHELDIDIWEVIRCAATKPFGFQPFYPGPGVGGHCIPIDPSYLSHRVQSKLGYPFRFVNLAQEVNRSMPNYVAHRVSLILNDQCRSVRGSKILLLGVTYKAGIADQRESPVRPLAETLFELGASIAYYDPFVPEWHLATETLTRVPDLKAALLESDLIVHLQPHSDYSDKILSEFKTPILDTRGILGAPCVIRL